MMEQESLPASKAEGQEPLVAAGAVATLVARMEAVRRPEAPQQQQEEAKLLAGTRSVEARELMGALEAVEAQRDELLQQLEAERGNLREAERRLREVEQDKENALSAAQVALQQLGDVTKGRDELTSKLKGAQDHIEKLCLEKAQLNGELGTRVQVVSRQRDDARSELVVLEKSMEECRQALEKAREQLKQQQALLATMRAAPAPQSAPVAGSDIPFSPVDPAAWFVAASQRTRIRGSGVQGAGSLSPARQLSTEQTNLEQRARGVHAAAQQLVAGRRKVDEERLLAAISANKDFHNGRPVVALAIFRCCLHWRCFQAQSTTVFDRIVRAIGDDIRKQQDDNCCLAYWLATTMTLLHLLQGNVHPPSARHPSRPRSAAPSTPSTAGHHPGPNGLHLSTARTLPVEANSPAVVFNEQLEAISAKVFTVVRANVRKQLTPMLASCSYTPPGRGGDAGPSKHWQDLVAALDALLEALKQQHVTPVLAQALFQQLFSFVNVQLFNEVMTRRECCSFVNGERVRAGLRLLDDWAAKAGEQHVGGAVDELRCIRQAATFLVIGNKRKKSLEDIARDFCPQLGIQQLYRLCSMYSDDEYGTQGVSAEVLSRMKALVEGGQGAPACSGSHLLHTDSKLPFKAQEVASQMDGKALYAGMAVPEQLKAEGTSSFAFLERDLDTRRRAAAP